MPFRLTDTPSSCVGRSFLITSDVRQIRVVGERLVPNTLNQVAEAIPGRRLAPFNAPAAESIGSASEESRSLCDPGGMFVNGTNWADAIQGKRLRVNTDFKSSPRI